MSFDYGAVIAHVCACTGWTWDYVAENVDLPRLSELNAYWADHPATHVMVAAYLGLGKKADAPTSDNQDFSALLGMGNFIEGGRLI